jgi:hypothetical protein
MDVSKMPWQLTLLPRDDCHPSEKEGWPDYLVGGLTLLQAALRLDVRVLDQTGNWLSASDPEFFSRLDKIHNGADVVAEEDSPEQPGGWVLKVLHRPTDSRHA